MGNGYLSLRERSVLTDHRIEHIILDFDGTLIREHTLVSWVRFLLLQSELPFWRKCFFGFKSICRGVLSVCFSRHLSSSEWAVRLAFRTFEGIETRTIDDLIRANHRKNGHHAISLNTRLLEILEGINDNGPPSPTVHIYSQGSFTYAIRRFLNREDVARRLEAIGIRADAVIIKANDLETDGNGQFTGRLSGSVRTKFNRVRKINGNSIFIGDDKDEAVLRKLGNRRIRFINWKKTRPASQGPLRPLSGNISFTDRPEG